ncbi:MAG: NADH-quinone oxidoreductase subunit N, partial [Bacteroidetes bacterium]|nr:NADH-quinone oxidoreductase subunit N [Bacteroidota bacterium]
MVFKMQEIYNLIPFVLISAGILVSLIFEMYAKNSKRIIAWFSVFIFLAAGFHSLVNVDNAQLFFNSMLQVGGNINIFIFLFNFAAALVVLMAMDYSSKYGNNFGEFYILLQSSVLGMMLMAGAKDLFVIFLGLEIMSVSFYALAGLNRMRLKANEASLKYFLLGSFATGFIVYGIALIFGSTNTTSIPQIVDKFGELTHNLLFMAGILMFLIGFSFKMAAFPFHMWVPDVYEGSATTVAGFFSTAGKTAAFSAVIITLGSVFMHGNANIFEPYLVVLAVTSMLYGSIVAIAQNNIKRMLAYSSIAHAGYLMIGLASGNYEGIAGIIFYLAAYTFMNLGAFGVVALIEGKDETNLTFESYTGLSKKQPFLAAMLAICMFSLAGIPPFAGFFGK